MTRSLLIMSFVDAFIHRLKPYITHINDVQADDNYGFMVITSLLGFGEDGWEQMRTDLLGELCSHLMHYN